MKRSLRWLSWITASVLFLLIFGFFVALPSSEALSKSRDVATALADARSVTIVELTQVLDMSGSSPDTLFRDVVLQSIPATPEQIHRFRAATKSFVSVELLRARTRCFSPHHRLEIVHRDGSTSRIDVCFQCTNMQLTPGHRFSIPGRWNAPLRDYFTSVGMPPRTSAEYGQLADKVEVSAARQVR
jgi:hypothetical protein